MSRMPEPPEGYEWSVIMCESTDLKPTVNLKKKNHMFGGHYFCEDAKSRDTEAIVAAAHALLREFKDADVKSVDWTTYKVALAEELGCRVI